MTRRPVLPIALLALVFAGSTEAETITHRKVIKPPGGKTTFPLFDPTLGKLTAVRWKLRLSINTSVVFDNETPQVVKGTFVLGGTVEVLGVSPGAFSLATPSYSMERTLPPDDEQGPPDFAGIDSTPIGRITASSTRKIEWVPHLLNHFEGVGNRPVFLGNLTATRQPEGVHAKLSHPDSLKLVAILTYEYDPTPKQSSLGLVGGVLPVVGPLAVTASVEKLRFRQAELQRQIQAWGGRPILGKTEERLKLESEFQEVTRKLSERHRQLRENQGQK